MIGVFTCQAAVQQLGSVKLKTTIVSGEKILFVDDDELIRKLVTTYLDRHGYAVTSATDGLEALRSIAADVPDLLITDVRMPGLSGLELTRQLRATQRTARLPIILLSSGTEIDEVLAGYGQGADEYVPKPVEMALLGAKVEVLLRLAHGSAPKPPARHGVVIAFIHGKGGVGTTTLAVNTAVAMSGSQSTRTVLLDLNREFANADMLLDARPEHRLDELAMYELNQVGDATFADLMTPHASGLFIVAGPSSPENGERITLAIAEFTLEHLRGVTDYLLVDLAATFSDVNLAAIDAADAICIVTSAEIAALKATGDCLRIVDRLDLVPHDRTLLVLNRTAPDGLTAENISRVVAYTPDVSIPHDPRFRRAADEGRPFVSQWPRQPSGRAIVNLANTLLGYRVSKQRAHLTRAIS